MITVQKQTDQMLHEGTILDAICAIDEHPEVRRIRSVTETILKNDHSYTPIIGIRVYLLKTGIRLATAARDACSHFNARNNGLCVVHNLDFDMDGNDWSMRNEYGLAEFKQTTESVMSSLAKSQTSSPYPAMMSAVAGPLMGPGSAAAIGGVGGYGFASGGGGGGGYAGSGGGGGRGYAGGGHSPYQNLGSSAGTLGAFGGTIETGEGDAVSQAQEAAIKTMQLP